MGKKTIEMERQRAAQAAQAAVKSRVDIAIGPDEAFVPKVLSASSVSVVAPSSITSSTVTNKSTSVATSLITSSTVTNKSTSVATASVETKTEVPKKPEVETKTWTQTKIVETPSTPVAETQWDNKQVRFSVSQEEVKAVSTPKIVREEENRFGEA